MKRFVSLSLLTLLFSTLALAQTPTAAGIRSLQGTTWEGTVRAPTSDGEIHENAYQFEFLSGNQLNWRRNNVDDTNGVWRQNGRVVTIELNNGYSTWVGTIEGDRITGSSTNKAGNKWNWTLTLKVQPATPAPQGAQPAGWIKYSSAEGRFSILLPSQPKTSEQSVDSAVGQMTNHVFLSQTGSAAFALSYADYPQNDADPQKVLDEVRAGALKGINGQLISVKNITHKGYPGREFQASVEGALYSSRIFLVKTRLYQMVCVAPAAQLSNEQINAFLTSFDLKVNEE